MDLDMALCAFSESVRGVKLRAEDCMSLIGRGVIQQEGLENSVMIVVGWWTVVYPNDWPAVLKYVPVELAWFLLKHVAVHGTVGQQPAFSPFRSGIASFARESWAQLGRYFNDHGVMEETRFGPGVLTGSPWPAPATTGRERYAQYREFRQALFASATPPGVPGWRAWLYNRPSSLDTTSCGYLDDEDIHLKFVGIGGRVTEHTAAVLHAVHAIGSRELYRCGGKHWAGWRRYC